MTNPFDKFGRQGAQPSSIDLETYAQLLNEGMLSRQAGWQWFVNTRHVDGEQIRYLDRRERIVATRWKPADGEGEATDFVIGKLLAQGTDQLLFNDMVRRGAVSRMVDERLAFMRGANG